MHISIEHYSVCSYWSLSKHRTDVVLTIVVHDVIGSNKGRYISSCLGREVRINLPIVGLTTCAADSFIDILRSCIIRCNDEIPVTEYLIEVAEIMRCGIRSLDRVATFVNHSGDFESVALACSEHKLPQTCSSHTADSVWIEC